MFKTIFITVVIFLATFLGVTAFMSNHSLSNKSLTISTEASPTSVLSIKNFQDPIKIVIPSLEVNASIEPVGLAPDRRMDVPKDYQNVAWWKLGVKPGEVGSAVLAGHFDTPTGDSGVFYQLKQLAKGDEVQVVDKEGEIQSFEVVETKSYKDSEFPIDLVFSQTDSRRLNLITCDGIFDETSKNYSDRFVIFTKLKE